MESTRSGSLLGSLRAGNLARRTFIPASGDRPVHLSGNNFAAVV